MKKVLVFATFVILAFSAYAQQDTIRVKPLTRADKYCVETRNLKAVLVHKGVLVASDISLNNGITIGADGILKKPDGSKTLLTVGECVDQDGNVEMAKSKQKAEQ